MSMRALDQTEKTVEIRNPRGNSQFTQQHARESFNSAEIQSSLDDPNNDRIGHKENIERKEIHFFAGRYNLMGFIRASPDQRQ